MTRLYSVLYHHTANTGPRAIGLPLPPTQPCGSPGSPDNVSIMHRPRCTVQKRWLYTVVSKLAKSTLFLLLLLLLAYGCVVKPVNATHRCPLSNDSFRRRLKTFFFSNYASYIQRIARLEIFLSTRYTNLRFTYR